MSNIERTVTVPFRVFGTQAFPDDTTTVTAFAVECTNLGDRVTALSDNFTQYRLTKLTFNVYTDCAYGAVGSANNETAHWSLSYCNSAKAAPTTEEQMVDEPFWMTGNRFMSETRRVPVMLLRRKGVPWYYTRDNGDDNLFIQGRWVVATTASNTIGTLRFCLEGTLQFAQPRDPDVAEASGLPKSMVSSDLSRLLRLEPCRKHLPRLCWGDVPASEALPAVGTVPDHPAGDGTVSEEKKEIDQALTRLPQVLSQLSEAQVDSASVSSNYSVVKSSPGGAPRPSVAQAAKEEILEILRSVSCSIESVAGARP
jgi:hypothetical protein